MNIIDKIKIKKQKEYHNLEIILFHKNKVKSQIDRDINRMNIFFNDIKLHKSNYKNCTNDIKLLSYMNQAPYAPIYELFVNLYGNAKKNIYIVDGGHDKNIFIITKNNKKYVSVISSLDIVKIIDNEKTKLYEIQFVHKIKFHKDYNKIKWTIA